MCCCDVVFPWPPCSMMHVHCLYRCILLQTGNNVCVRLEKRNKKKKKNAKPLLHAPLVHQGNNRLIQRLRSGPRVWIMLTWGFWDGGGLSVTQWMRGARHPAHTLTSSNKQRDAEQTLTPDTPLSEPGGVSPPPPPPPLPPSRSKPK